MDDSVRVDEEATAGEAFDFAVRQPVLGNVVQNLTLAFPNHEVPRALHLECHLLIVCRLIVEPSQILNTASPRIQCSYNHRNRNRYAVRGNSVPPPQERPAHSHYTFRS